MSNSGVLGGLSEAKKADASIQEICNKVKPDLEKMSGKVFTEFSAKLYKTQPVDGTNYFIKVHVGGQDYFHIRVFQSLPCDGEKLKLISYQHSKSLSDPIEYF
ncbi:cystatin-B-like [Oryzias melastigma]|nr:cystatin-B-like [Oryzias melastigma]